MRGNAVALATVTGIVDGTGSIGAAIGQARTAFLYTVQNAECLNVGSCLQTVVAVIQDKTKSWSWVFYFLMVMVRLFLHFNYYYCHYFYFFFFFFFFRLFSAGRQCSISGQTLH